MPRPQTFTDAEILSKISDFFLLHDEFPTIAEVKRWGCGDTRAQYLLKEAKGFNPIPQPQPQPEPQPQPQPKPTIHGHCIVHLNLIPAWMFERMRKLGVIEFV